MFHHPKISIKSNIRDHQHSIIFLGSVAHLSRFVCRRDIKRARFWRTDGQTNGWTVAVALLNRRDLHRVLTFRRSDHARRSSYKAIIVSRSALSGGRKGERRKGETTTSLWDFLLPSADPRNCTAAVYVVSLRYSTYPRLSACGAPRSRENCRKQSCFLPSFSHPRSEL